MLYSSTIVKAYKAPLDLAVGAMPAGIRAIINSPAWFAVTRDRQNTNIPIFEELERITKHSLAPLLLEGGTLWLKAIHLGDGVTSVHWSTFKDVPVNTGITTLALVTNNPHYMWDNVPKCQFL
jgi:hypothetical protein